MHLLLLSCKKATSLIEKKLIVPLSFKEKVQLNMHMGICDACKAYEKQSKKIDRLLQKHVQSEGLDQTPLVTNNDLKESILKNLPPA